jgi:hypothetical protein
MEVINHISKKRPTDGIPELMKCVSVYVLETEPIIYKDLIEFIDNNTSGKMGGVYIAQAKAMAWLKDELKKIKKSSADVPEENSEIKLEPLQDGNEIN